MRFVKGGLIETIFLGLGPGMPAGKRASLSKELLSLPRKGSLTEAPTAKFFMTALTKSCTLPNFQGGSTGNTQEANNEIC